MKANVKYLLNLAWMCATNSDTLCGLARRLCVLDFKLACLPGLSLTTGLCCYFDDWTALLPRRLWTVLISRQLWTVLLSR